MSSLFIPGRVLAETGTSIFSRLIRRFTGSRWTHVSIIINDTTLIESVFPYGVREVPIVEAVQKLAGREWALLEMWGTEEFGTAIAAAAQKHNGEQYDFLQCVLLGVFGRFMKDGPMRVICSRLVTAAHWDAALFLFTGPCPPGVSEWRWKGMLRGYCTPGDLVRHSVLKIVHHVPAS